MKHRAWNRVSRRVVLLCLVLAFSLSNFFLAAPGVLRYTSHEDTSLRVAVVVSGSFSRYFLTSSMTHLLHPMVTQGHHVDYYLALGTDTHTPWRIDKYTEARTWDPTFGLKQPSSDHVRTVVKTSVHATGATLVRLDLFSEMPLVDDVRILAKRAAAKKLRPSEDPDERFPVHSLGKGNKAAANRNILRLYRALERLWGTLEQTEEQAGVAYDYVLILRDDAMFSKDLNLNKLLTQDRHADLFVLACDAREPKMLPSEINDHAAFMARPSADLLGRLYTRILETDVADDCIVQSSKQGPRQCTSEELSRSIFQSANVSIAYVDQSFIPFQRGAYVRWGGAQPVVACFHKHCQSVEHPLPNLSGLLKCKALSLIDRPACPTRPNDFHLQSIGEHPTYSDLTTFPLQPTVGCGFSDNNPSSDYLMLVVAPNLQRALRRAECGGGGMVFYSAFLSHSFLGDPPEAVYAHTLTTNNNLACSVLFVLASSNTPLIKSREGWLQVALDPKRLPYQETRRNVKVLKLLGSRLFHWPKVLVWIDTKLKLRVQVRDLYAMLGAPNGTCFVGMGLPDHPASMEGNTSEPMLARQAAAIVKAARKRPTVSDSLETVNAQVKTYLDDSWNGGAELSDNLIDSAILLRQFDSERCKRTDAALSCAWFNEIACYSDRDQLSFPVAIHKIGLEDTAKNGNQSRLLTDINGQPAVFIAHSSMHWYYSRELLTLERAKQRSLRDRLI